MADIKKIKDKITSTIYPNGKGAINATDHQAMLLEMADGMAETDTKLTELSQEVEHQGIFIEDLRNTKIDKEADDYYPQLSVGTADNLSGVDEVSRVFSYDRSGGGVIADGVARVQSIKGNSVVWNNLVDTRDKVGDSGWIYRNNDLHLTQGHKYALIRSKAIGGLYCIPVINGQEIYDYSLRDNIYAKIFTSAYTTTPSTTHLFCEQNVGAVALIDLTKMVGCGYEPTTIEEFNARIPMGIDLYSFNGGEVIDMNVQGIKSVGRNLFNEEWEKGIIYSDGSNNDDYTLSIRSKGFIRVIGGETYYYANKQNNAADYLNIFFYDKDKNFILRENRTIGNFDVPSNAAFIRFYVNDTYGTTYKNDICINLSDSDFNGQYEPYMEASEDLSIVANFPNGMRSAGSAHDEIRYNKASNRWEKVVRIAEVDMATLNWGTGFGGIITSDLQSRIRKPSKANEDYVLCPIIPTNGEGKNISIIYGGEGYDYNGWLKVLGYESLDNFLADIQGAKLYYELAEPIVTPIEEKDFNLDYKVWNCGTEQAIAEGKSSALSANITYGFNAVGLIKHLRSLVEAMSAKLANL